MEQSPLTPILEFARAEQADDAFAFRFVPQTYRLRTAGGGVQHANFPWDGALLAELFRWSEADFNERMAGSPIYRIGYERWLRNLAVGLGNAPSSVAAIAARTPARRAGSASVAVSAAVDSATSPVNPNAIGTSTSLNASSRKVARWVSASTS